MSSTNKTPYFELPQFIGTDIPTWLGDFNGAMSDIDTALKTNADRADLASTQAGQAVNTANAANDAVSALQTSVAGLGNRVTACEETDTAQSTQISQNASNISSLDGRVTTLEQSGGGNANVFKMLIGSYSGAVSGLKTNMLLTGSSAPSIDNDKAVGILLDITIGNAHGQAFYADNTSYHNRIATTFDILHRIYAGSAVTRHTIQLELSSDSSGRTVTYVSSIRQTYATTSGQTSGTVSNITTGYNADGVSDITTDNVDLKLYLIYVD